LAAKEFILSERDTFKDDLCSWRWTNSLRFLFWLLIACGVTFWLWRLEVWWWRGGGTAWQLFNSFAFHAAIVTHVFAFLSVRGHADLSAFSIPLVYWAFDTPIKLFDIVRPTGEIDNLVLVVGMVVTVVFVIGTLFNVARFAFHKKWQHSRAQCLVYATSFLASSTLLSSLIPAFLRGLFGQ
jgi:hypothetical protein